MNVSGVILAGGKSSRMGTDKSNLALNENKTLISNVVELFTNFFDEVIVVSNKKNKYGFINVTEVSDIYPETGPLGGIHTGLSSSKNEFIFVVACDMPFLDWKLIKYLIELSVGFDATVPNIGGRLEPLHAVYSKSCIPYIEDLLNKKKYKVNKLFSHVKVNYVDEQSIKELVDIEKTFLNINTPEDYRNIKKIEGE